MCIDFGVLIMIIEVQDVLSTAREQQTMLKRKVSLKHNLKRKFVQSSRIEMQLIKQKI